MYAASSDGPIFNRYTNVRRARECVVDWAGPRHALDRLEVTVRKPDGEYDVHVERFDTVWIRRSVLFHLDAKAFGRQSSGIQELPDVVRDATSESRTQKLDRFRPAVLASAADRLVHDDFVRPNLGDEPRSSIVSNENSWMTRVVYHERIRVVVSVVFAVSMLGSRQRRRRPG